MSDLLSRFVSPMTRSQIGEMYRMDQKFNMSVGLMLVFTFKKDENCSLIDGENVSRPRNTQQTFTNQTLN